MPADNAGFQSKRRSFWHKTSNVNESFRNPDRSLAGVDPTTPQTWNAYVYVTNDPINFVDPQGRACVNSRFGDMSDPNNFSDDDSGGQSCADAFASPPQTVTVDTIPEQVPFNYSGFGNQDISISQPGQRRPYWQNAVTSIFGYDQNDSPPSCFGIAMASTAGQLNPFSPDVSGLADPAGQRIQ